MTAGVITSGTENGQRSQFGLWIKNKLRDQVRTLSDGVMVQAHKDGTYQGAARWRLNTLGLPLEGSRVSVREGGEGREGSGPKGKSEG